jgi:toxin CptA
MSGPLRLRLKRSKSLALLLCAAHVVPAAALWASPLPIVADIGGSVLLALSATWSVRGHAFRTAPGSVVELELYEDCTLSARTADGRWLQCKMVGSSFCSRVLTVLNLRSESAWGVHPVLISADSVEPDAFRRLRIWLRWRYAAVSLNGIDGK